VSQTKSVQKNKKGENKANPILEFNIPSGNRKHRNNINGDQENSQTNERGQERLESESKKRVKGGKKRFKAGEDKATGKSLVFETWYRPCP